MSFKWVLLVFTALFVSNSYAGDIHLLVWQPTPDSPRYLIPQKSSETPKQAIERYRAFLFAGTGLKEVAPPSMFANGDGKAEALEVGGAKSLFVANMEKDHTDGSQRFQKFQRQLHATDNYLLPLGALGRLSPAERKQFHTQVTERFSGLILMGGEDVAPSTYGEKPTGARNFNLDRDKLEIELIRDYVKAEKGFVFGICRGLQITSVALGFQ